MKINSNQISSSINRISQYTKFILFGPDEAGIQYYLKEIVNIFKKSGDYEKFDYTFKEIRSDPSIIRDSLMERSLFGDKKIVIVKDVASNASKEFLDFIKNCKSTNILIIVAGDLKPASGLRKLGEEANDIASIACYKDDQRTLAAFVENLFREKKINFERGVSEILLNSLPSSKALIEQEIEKLSIYLNGAILDFETVTELSSDIGDANFDSLFHQILLGQGEKIEKSLRRANDENISFMLILRTLLRQFAKLEEIFTLAKYQEISPKEAVEKITPPLFFKIKPMFAEAINKTSHSKVKRYIKELVDVELSCKTKNLNQDLLLNNYIMQLTYQHQK